jgi:hypothetical protein
MTSAPASGLAERNQRHDLDGFNVGLNLSYRDSAMATRIWLDQLHKLVDRGGRERRGTTHTGARREGRRSAGRGRLAGGRESGCRVRPW